MDSETSSKPQKSYSSSMPAQLMMKPALQKASVRSLLRKYPCKSIPCLIAVIVLLPVIYCVVIDAKCVGLTSKCFFDGGVSASSGTEPVHDKYLPLHLADWFFETIEPIWFYLSLNVNDYRDSVARHWYHLCAKLGQYNFHFLQNHAHICFYSFGKGLLNLFVHRTPLLIIVLETHSSHP